MKKLGDKGFSAVEGLLILVIIGIIGGAIFYVHKANNNVSNGGDGTTISSKSKSAVKSESQFKTYTFDKTGLSFKYPKEYKLDDFGPSKDTLRYSRLVFLSKISYNEISKAINRDKYDKYLQLSITELENNPDTTFKEKRALFASEKVIGNTMINSKKYYIVSTRDDGGSVVDVNVMDCDSAGKCNDLIPINGNYSTQVGFFSVANTESPTVTIDTNSDEYKAFIDILKSVSVNP